MQRSSVVVVLQTADRVASCRMASCPSAVLVGMKQYLNKASCVCVQGHPVRLETANAALLEGSGDTWADAFASDSQWKLVGILAP